MKILKSSLLITSIALLSFTGISFAQTLGCQSLVGTWKGWGTINEKPQWITVNISSVTPSGNVYNESNYTPSGTISGTINGVFSLNGSVCTEKTTPIPMISMMTFIGTDKDYNKISGETKSMDNPSHPHAINFINNAPAYQNFEVRLFKQ